MKSELYKIFALFPLLIVSDMIKELDKDISKETADVMAEVLKQVDGDVTPEVVHNVSAIVSQDEEPTLELNDIAVIGKN